MFSVDGKYNIQITRGDSASLDIALYNDDGSPYELAEGDTLTMTVKDRAGTKVYLEETYTSKTIDLTPEQTDGFAEGKCRYTVKLNTAAGDVYTIIGVESNMQSNMLVMPK